MPKSDGRIVLMGSGELTSTMVEVHKEILSSLGKTSKAVFLDTPAGFQLNADLLSKKASEYFQTRIRHPLKIASFKSKETCTAFEAEKAYRTLRESDFVLIGPGSPTYAVRQWLETPIPNILQSRIKEGGCLVAASAAALTVGCQTLPVYEIYKVGEHIHWAEGMNILGQFGLNLVVIPHWNNAEGGTHDTRFCYMGEPRFRELESLLPDNISVLGLDEHTACIIDFGRDVFSIQGIGNITLRSQGKEIIFKKGDYFSLDFLRGLETNEINQIASFNIKQKVNEVIISPDSFWNRVNGIRELFQNGIKEHSSEKIVNSLLDLDSEVWKAQQELETQEFISQAREVLRDMIVLIGSKLASCPESAEACLDPLVETLIHLRERFRNEKKWLEADAIRDSLTKADILIEDLKEGARWRLKQ